MKEKVFNKIKLTYEQKWGVNFEVYKDTLLIFWKITSENIQTVDEMNRLLYYYGVIDYYMIVENHNLVYSFRIRDKKAIPLENEEKDELYIKGVNYFSG